MNMFTAMLAMMALLTWSSSHAQTLVIARAGSRPIRQAPAENFTGSVRVEMLFEAREGPTREWRLGHVRAWCPHGVALASRRPDPDRHGRHRPRSAMG